MVSRHFLIGYSIIAIAWIERAEPLKQTESGYPVTWLCFEPVTPETSTQSYHHTNCSLRQNRKHNYQTASIFGKRLINWGSFWLVTWE